MTAFYDSGGRTIGFIRIFWLKFSAKFFELQTFLNQNGSNYVFVTHFV